MRRSIAIHFSALLVFSAVVAEVLSDRAFLLSVGIAHAKKDKTAENGTKAKKKKPVAAKKLFGGKKKAADLKPEAIGYYSRGCLAGGKMLPENGPAWQAMRLYRNRNWGHPLLIEVIERLATEAKAAGEFPGLLVGDLNQPRGGPMTSGHASHQVGLDADIWLRLPPKKRLTTKQQYSDYLQPHSMVNRKNWLDVNPKYFTEKQVALIKRVASYPEVGRVGVNPAIKYALCKAAGGDTPWLAKIQGWAGHHYHMHVRLKCPPGSKSCRDQSKPRATSCKYAEKWYADKKAWIDLPAAEKKKRIAKKKKKKKVKRKPKPPITLAGLPSACRSVLAARDLEQQEPIKKVEEKLVVPREDLLGTLIEGLRE